MELHFNYYFHNNFVFKQFSVLKTAWHDPPEYQENERFSTSWYWVRTPGEIWPVIYIIVWYLQCQLITWSDYLSGRTIEDLISSKTVARGSVLAAPGVLVTARRVVGGGWCRVWYRQARCDNYILELPTLIVLLSAQYSTGLLARIPHPPATSPLDICNVSCWFAKPGQLRVRGNYCNWLKHFLTQFWLCSANSTVIAQINNGNAKTQLWFSQFFAVVSSWECPVKRLSQWEPRDLVSRVDWSASGVYKVQAWILWQQQSEWWMVTTPTLLLLLTQNSFCLLMVCINE